MPKDETPISFDSSSTSSSSTPNIVRHFLGSASHLRLRIHNVADDAYETRLRVAVLASANGGEDAFVSFANDAPPDCKCASDESSCECGVGNPLRRDDDAVEIDFQFETVMGVAVQEFGIRIDKMFLEGKADGVTDQQSDLY